jgi:hypothetical protein
LDGVEVIKIRYISRKSLNTLKRASRKKRARDRELGRKIMKDSGKMLERGTQDRKKKL